MTDNSRHARAASDPIVRSLLDTDFYKLLMQQMIHRLHPRVDATFSLINRTTKVRLADEIDEVELRAQLDHVRTLSFTEDEVSWLASTAFYGIKQIFAADYLNWLRSFRLPPYELSHRDGQYILEFRGRWDSITMWEIYALEIVTELHGRSALRKIGPQAGKVAYECAKVKLLGKIDRLRALKNEGPLRVTDFGTRRRHSLSWQRWCNEAMRDGLGDGYLGTSNVLIAKELGLAAIGTNGHELSMAYAALAAPDAHAMLASRYRVLADWQSMYGGNLLVVLPDTYGTTAFLRDAPRWVAGWAGARPDSKEPIAGGDEWIDWWIERGENPKEKLLILSDGVDIDSIETTFRHFNGRARVSYGWGTNLTNDFRDCGPGVGHALDPMSLVCKITEVDGRPAVKLSDNPSKATGDRAAIADYLRTFGGVGMTKRAVTV